LNTLSVTKIWAVKPHSAFTDLIFFKERLLVIFREANTHFGDDGTLRLIESLDQGLTFKTVALFEKKGWDLRDPKLCLTPQGKLQIHFQAIKLTPKKKKYKESVSYTIFSEEARFFSKMKRISKKHEWPWRITWSEKEAYVASYTYTNPKNRKEPWSLTLMKSQNGVDFTKITTWPFKDYPNETTLRVLENQKMVALVRVHEKKVPPFFSYNWIGTSSPPYNEWVWQKSSSHLGGPNFLVYQDKMIASGRLLYKTPYALQEKVALFQMTEKELKPLLLLPSSGDCSYPGLFLKENTLFVSYYSSHEHNTAIYLAKISLP
jgi:hypothetical protein